MRIGWLLHLVYFLVAVLAITIHVSFLCAVHLAIIVASAGGNGQYTFSSEVLIVSYIAHIWFDH